MTKTAQVIVDVPTMQTDRPFDYAIPAELSTTIMPGMRVEVPFGRGKRQVLGFVVAISEQQFQGELKEITTLIDTQPVLNAEMLQLSIWLAEQTFSFRIQALQTMLPSAMRGHYQRVIHRLQPIDTPFSQRLFKQGETVVVPEALSLAETAELSNWQKQNLVEIYQQVENRAHSKKETMILPQLNAAAIQTERETIRHGAAKQVALLDYLAKLPLKKTQPLAKVMADSGLSRSVWKSGEKKGWLVEQQVEVYRKPYQTPSQLELTTPLTLTAEQQTALTAIVKAEKEQTFLLEGVTGSGKTEIYLQAIDHALKAGKTALMLVPEIALTPQMVTRVMGRFGQTVAVLHSGLSEGEKYDEWRRIQRQEAKVVVGARSAIFAPLQNLGLIIMDEEHESSYKQDDTPRYQARQVARWRSAFYHCPLVLGSATPSLESRARAQKGVYQLLRLTQRINQQPLPPVQIIDMRQETKQAGGDLSPQLVTALQACIQRHEQSVLLLNRRGYSSFVLCRECGYVVMCPNCDISLTLHMDSHTLKCHYCGHEEAIPRICPNCHSSKIRYYGTGTEKVAEQLAKILPQATVLRMDVDTTRRKGAHEKILKSFGDHQADILLGTQMIAKGLDFPNVTLVGVINADTSLGLPDFRASERTFDLLTQVSGRAGRADKAGQVLIQTFNPEHYAIQFAQKQDYEGFYRYEMQVRHRGNYPPYFFTVQVTVSHEDENAAAKKIYEIAHVLKPVLSETAILLGPTKRAIARVNRRYYYQLVIKYKHEDQLFSTLAQIMRSTQSETRSGYQIALDNEPLQFM